MEAKESRERRLPIWKRVAYGLIPAALLLAGGEILARLFHEAPADLLIKDPLTGNPNLDLPDYFVAHDRLFWSLRADLNRPTTIWGDVSNSLGFRNEKDPERPKTRTRVLCMGDSVTYGYGVPHWEAWPGQLEKMTGWEALNASCPGYTSYQGAILHELRAEDLEAEALVLQYGPNDNSYWASHQDGQWFAVSDRDRSAQMSYGRIDSALLRWLVSLRMSTPQNASHLPERDIIPRVSVDEYAANLRSLARKAPLCVVLVWPTRQQLDPGYALVPAGWSDARYRTYQDAARGLAKDGVLVIDVLDLYRRSGLPASELLRDLVHAKPLGAELVATAVAARLRAAGLK